MSAAETLHAALGGCRCGLDDGTSGSTRDNDIRRLSLIDNVDGVGLDKRCGVGNGGASTLVAPDEATIAVRVGLSGSITLCPPSSSPEVAVVANLVATNVLQVIQR